MAVGFDIFKIQTFTNQIQSCQPRYSHHDTNKQKDQVKFSKFLSEKKIFEITKNKYDYSNEMSERNSARS